MNTEYQDGCQWRLLSETHSALINNGEKFKLIEDWKDDGGGGATTKLQTYLDGVKFMAAKIKETFPWRYSDGYSNIWLLKPARTGEGKAIFFLHIAGLEHEGSKFRWHILEPSCTSHNYL